MCPAGFHWASLPSSARLHRRRHSELVRSDVGSFGRRFVTAGCQHQREQKYADIPVATYHQRLSHYLWYSLGEIILVVIGILIAIQVNNWNEDRIEQRQVHAYARALASDLLDDIAAVRVSAYNVSGPFILRPLYQ